MPHWPGLVRLQQLVRPAWAEGVRHEGIAAGMQLEGYI